MWRARSICGWCATGEPFDFVTLFDYAEADAAAFEDMVARLRATEEWKYVEGEVDLRLVRDGGAVRLRDAVRLRGGRRGGVRGYGGPAAGDGGVEVCGARGRSAVGARRGSGSTS